MPRAEKRALSQVEQRFGAKPNRAPNQVEPGLESMVGKRSLSGSDQVINSGGDFFLFHWLVFLNVSKTTFWLLTDWPCGYVARNSDSPVDPHF